MLTYDNVIRTHSPEETLALGVECAKLFSRGDCIALSGNLGSGKTEFVRGVCRYFRCEGQVSSPTFTIINEYAGDERVVHCDVYRLHDAREIFHSGIGDVFLPDNFILIEWAEKALDLLPVPRWEILFAHGEHDLERIVRIHYCNASHESILLLQTSNVFS